MISKAHIAIFAFRYPTTCMTLYHRSKPTSVLEKNYLLLPFQRIVYFLDQQWRERTFHPLLMRQLFDVHPFNMRQLNILISLLQFYQAIFTISRIEIGFHARSSRTQKHFRSIHRSRHNGRTTSMIAGSWAQRAYGDQQHLQRDL